MQKNAEEAIKMSNQDLKMKIKKTCDNIATLLIDKNEAYGNSALDPIRIFSRSDTVEQLNVRIDDKLSRIGRGKELSEDVVTDLIGYLVLLKVAKDG